MSSRREPAVHHGLDLGAHVSDEGVRGRVSVFQNRRAEHLALLGKTGTGKSSLLRYICQQDINAGRGFISFDLHGDTTPFLLRSIAMQERIQNRDLSDKLIVIDPADPHYSVGMNLLEQQSDVSGRFAQIAEFAQILKDRWHLETFGARTDELLRNALHVLAENGQTLLELPLFLSHTAFRAKCLRNITNGEIKNYFALRYDQASEPMRAVMREPILNKTSAFTADPRFRHIVGQKHSTFSMREAMDQSFWIVLNLHKGKLGEQAATLGSLLLTKLKNALFSRQSRELFTVIADEVQNLVAFGSGLEVVLSESRKFALSVACSTQFLDQLPPEMRSALLAVGTLIAFQLSSTDAQHIATALDGGKSVAELLKHLPRRHIVVKTGHERWREAVVPAIEDPKADFTDLYDRSRKRWARKREEIEQEIAQRQALVSRKSSEAIDDWE